MKKVLKPLITLIMTTGGGERKRVAMGLDQFMDFRKKLVQVIHLTHKLEKMPLLN